MTDSRRHSSADLYAANHQHPMNRVLHAIGIPLIACSALATIFGPRIVGAPRPAALAGVIVGSALLFVGHAIEGNRPAIFTRRGAMLDAVRWWAGGAGRLATRIFR